MAQFLEWLDETILRFCFAIFYRRAIAADRIGRRVGR